MGIESMGMGGNGNVESHSRTSLIARSDNICNHIPNGYIAGNRKKGTFIGSWTYDVNDGTNSSIPDCINQAINRLGWSQLVSTFITIDPQS